MTHHKENIYFVHFNGNTFGKLAKEIIINKNINGDHKI